VQDIIVSPGRRVLVGTYVDRRVKAALARRASSSERTVSGELRLAIDRHLRAKEEEPSRRARD
jgi:hypothetical protein